MYDPNYFQKNKEKMQNTTKAYRQRKSDERKKAIDCVIDKLMLDETEIRKALRKKATYIVNNRETARKRNDERLHNDPEYRERKRVYLQGYNAGLRKSK